MRHLILLSALLLTACPLPYCPVRPIPPNAPKLHTKAPSSTAFAREKQSESKLPNGDTMHIGSECITVHNRTLTLHPCRNMPNQYFERIVRNGTIRQNGQCLTQTGSNITLESCTGKRNQEWYSDGKRLCSRSANAQCWSVSQHSVRLQTRNDSPEQEVLR